MDKFINWCRRYSIPALRWSMGLVFLWFGLLKFFPRPGEAEDIGFRTVRWLSGGNLGERTALLMLGGIEMLIGIGLLLRKWMGLTLLLLFFQLAGTFLPLVIFRDEAWDAFLKPSLAGHYIIKNIVLIAAGIVLAATVDKSSEEKKDTHEKVVK